VEEACKSAIKETAKIKPNKKATALYDKHYAIYRKLYGDLKQRFGEMAALV
jgi:sugar (pentulose or hexulose) kinase